MKVCLYILCAACVVPFQHFNSHILYHKLQQNFMTKARKENIPEKIHYSVVCNVTRNNKMIFKLWHILELRFNTVQNLAAHENIKSLK